MTVPVILSPTVSPLPGKSQKAVFPADVKMYVAAHGVSEEIRGVDHNH